VRLAALLAALALLPACAVAPKGFGVEARFAYGGQDAWLEFKGLRVAGGLDFDVVDLGTRGACKLNALLGEPWKELGMYCGLRQASDAAENLPQLR